MVLFIVLTILTLWKGIPTGIQLWQYSRLEGEVPVQNISFEAIPKKGKYALEGTYAFDFQGKTYQGKTLLAPPYHLNHPSAKQEIERMRGLKWMAWINPTHPSVSSLEKNFPLRGAFYTGCLLCLMIYFLYLRIHLQLLSRSM